MFLTISSKLPFFIILGVLFLIGYYIVKNNKFYRELINMELKGRHEAIDGLRGFLALGVFFQHAVTNHYYFTNGIWQITDIRFYRHLGGEAVILFFMITSFLYWSRAIKNEGRFDIAKLYKNRLLRLAPMYLASALVIIFITLILTGFSIVSPLHFAKDIFSWLTLGINTTLTTNGVSILPINAGIHWTLYFEWIFYIFMPFAAFALRKHLHFLIVPLIMIVYFLPQRGYWIIFIFGILAAHIFSIYPHAKILRRNIFSVLILLGFVAIYFIQHKPYSLAQYFVTLLIFLCIVYGNDLFGLLKSKASIFLGTISYSIYLIHGLVLFGVLNFFNYLKDIKSMSIPSYWMIILLCGILTVLISSVTYRYIEHPFILKTQKRKDENIKLADRIV
jgi:peptidoglycan/LPS O-acetylase OafA/YrhL